MVRIPVTAAELAARNLNPEHLSEAVAALRRDGLVVLEDVVDLSHLDPLRERMLADVDQIIARPDAPFNWHAGNVQQDPPPFPPYLFHDVLLNDQAVAVTRALLGRGVKNSFYSGNTAMPGTQRQPVHVDTGQLWPGLEVAHPACSLVVNVPVVDMTPENGSTEIWPGTHLDTTVSRYDTLELPSERVEQRRGEVPPIQPSVRRGSVIIRDIRLWHAGMPNHTASPRPMIAMIHHCSWVQLGTPLVFPTGTEPFFAESELRTHARFTDESIDYIRAPRGYKAPAAPSQLK